MLHRSRGRQSLRDSSNDVGAGMYSSLQIVMIDKLEAAVCDLTSSDVWKRYQSNGFRSLGGSDKKTSYWPHPKLEGTAPDDNVGRPGL